MSSNTQIPRQLIIADPLPQQSSLLMTLPDELLLKIVLLFGLNNVPYFVTTCRAATAFVDYNIMTQVFALEYSIR